MAKSGSGNGDSKSSLLAELEFSKSSYQSAPRNALVFSLTNRSKRTLSVLKWYTPLEGFKSDIFEVRRAGKPVPYVGRLYKRAAPTAEDYVTLRPGRTVRQAVDFFDAYDVAASGTYNVQYRMAMLHAGSAAPAELAKKFAARGPRPLVAVRANTAIFTLTRSRKSKLAGMALAAAKRGSTQRARKARKVKFGNCSDEQQAAVHDALDAAITMANAARDDLDNAPSWARPNAPRYREWFGEYNSGRYAKASDHFREIADALANKSMKFFCNCKSDDFAYVVPWMPHHIHLCKAFWNAALTGTDSQAGTLIHEMSHFWVVANTNDRVYGQPACRSLAIGNPDSALDNGDSHEYFAENTPALGMDPAPGSISLITDVWHGMPSGFHGGFDAMLNGSESPSSHCYFFKGSSYVRYDWDSDRADPGYPKSIAADWHSMPAGFTSGFDAAINGLGNSSGKCFFFKGGSYVRYDWGADRADPGYPKPIAGSWPNMPAGFTSDFDAVINRPAGFDKCYFFKGDSYVRYDWIADSVDPGYPKSIAGSFHALPADFTGSYSDALEMGGPSSIKGYFLKGDFCICYNWAFNCAEL